MFLVFLWGASNCWCGFLAIWIGLRFDSHSLLNGGFWFFLPTNLNEEGMDPKLQILWVCIIYIYYGHHVSLRMEFAWMGTSWETNWVFVEMCMTLWIYMILWVFFNSEVCGSFFSFWWWSKSWLSCGFGERMVWWMRSFDEMFVCLLQTKPIWNLFIG
jgi:hypothetical protein